MSRIDVVLPGYNGEAIIGKAIESALAQDVDLRIIVIDDGSTDGTAAAARAYGEKVVVTQQANRGVSGARNAALAQATAPYVAFLDQDDRWQPGKLARQLALMEAHPEVGLVFTDMIIEDERGGAIEDGFLATTRAYAALAKQAVGDQAYLLDDAVGLAVVRFNFISPSTTLVRRSALTGIGGFDESLRLCDDADCWMRLLLRWRAIAIEDRLVRSLRWGGNASLARWRNLIHERFAIGRKVDARPELFPAGAAAYFRKERPVSLYRLGVGDLNAGDMAAARANFRDSLREEWRFTTALAFAATLLPGFLRRGLLRLKRATGARWAIRVE